MPATALNNDRSFWRVFTVLSGVVALLKGVQLPSVVPATQAQIDYSTGFIKRGLFGTVAEFLHIPIHHYNVFAAVSFVILAAFCATVVWATRRSGLTRSQLGLLACAAFFSSYAVTYAASLVGRFDIIQMGVTATIISIRRPALRNAILLIASPLCILLHENFFIAFLPVCLLPTVIEFLVATDGRRPWTGTGLAVAALVLSLITVVALAAENDAHPTVMQGLYDRIARHIDFEADGSLVGIMDRGIIYNVRLMRSFVWAPGYRYFDFVLSLATFLPSCAYLVLCARELVNRINPARTRPVVVALVICVVPPLALNALGADMDRWNAFVVFNAFAALLAVSGLAMRDDAMLAAPAPVWTYAAIVLVATNLASGGGLLEGKCVKSYPFRTHVQTLYEDLHGHLPARPKRPVFGQVAPC